VARGAQHLHRGATGLLRSLIRSVRRAFGARDAAQLALPLGARPRRTERTHPDDEMVAAKLLEWHGRMNGERFDGALGEVPVRVSRRMRSRLGHYAPARGGASAEIAISRLHVRRHGFASAVQTLLHEMVHQWQDENGLGVDHGAGFKRKARAVGVSPRASRVVD
jgi:hypothetical protein